MMSHIRGREYDAPHQRDGSDPPTKLGHFWAVSKTPYMVSEWSDTPVRDQLGPLGGSKSEIGFWPNLWGSEGDDVPHQRGGSGPHIFGGLLDSVKIPLYGDIQALLGFQTSGNICGG